ncbi:MAG: TPM domain-containing protein [Firmicutes bacterium]|nr:TPM domain-containing protein [Bacillota bacterium]
MKKTWLCLLITLLVLFCLPLSAGADDSSGDTGSGELPDWYVTDPNSFEDFHNDINDPRLIDQADLLTPEQEAQIEARLDQVREATQQDIVIFTDTTSYGMDNELYEMDFYVYNGYGLGPNFDGLILFINMDPDNREMVSTAFGKTRDVFDAANSNMLDDILYDHLVEQEYFEAFLSWSFGVENMLKYGIVDLPAWCGAYLSSGQVLYPSGVRLINEVGGISESDTQRILERLSDLSVKYQTEVVVYLTDKYYDLSHVGSDALPVAEGGPRGEDSEEIEANRYLDTFWAVEGYGYSEDHRGILLGIFVDESSLYNIQVRMYGSGAAGKAKELSDSSEKRLESVTLLNLGEGNYAYNVNRYLDFLGSYMKTGHVPHSWFVRGLWALACAFVGLLTGRFSTERAIRKNNVVREETRADVNLISDSFRVLWSRNVLLGTRVEKRYIPKPSESSSSTRSSSGSRSHYSSNSRSSSGRSGSTSRRKF